MLRWRQNFNWINSRYFEEDVKEMYHIMHIAQSKSNCFDLLDLLLWGVLVVIAIMVTQAAYYFKENSIRKYTLWVSSRFRRWNGIRKNATPVSRKQTPTRMMGILTYSGNAVNGVCTTRWQRPKSLIREKRKSSAIIHRGAVLLGTGKSCEGPRTTSLSPCLCDNWGGGRVHLVGWDSWASPTNQSQNELKQTKDNENPLSAVVQRRDLASLTANDKRRISPTTILLHLPFPVLLLLTLIEHVYVNDKRKSYFAWKKM